MAVRKIRKRLTGSSGISCIWAMKTAATAWKSAVPFMLTVAPKGATKLVVRAETPSFPFRHSIVSGRVAEEEAVEKAVVKAGIIPVRNGRGERRVRRTSSTGSVTRLWIPRPASTVTV